MAITSANQLELLQTAEAVAREKQIDPGLVVEAMEESLARAAKSRYGSEMDIRVSIDRKTGRATFTRVRTVVEDEELENYQAEMTVETAKQYMAEPTIGDTLVEEVPPVEMGRIAAQSAKQVILQKVREAERDKQFEEFKDRIGTIINVAVKREEYGNIIVDLNPGEGVLRRNEKIGREAYRPNDRIRVYIKDVRREPRGPQIFLSRTAPEFMAELFKMEVPEIYEGIIEIKAVARDPGSRAKIGVISHDNSIDPVGACDPAANLPVTLGFIRQAAAQGAELVLTPEVTNCVSADRAHQRAVLQSQEADITLAALRAEARRLHIHLLIGSLALIHGDKFVNRSFLIAPDGEIAAHYDKIHMFDVAVSDTETYRESAAYTPGTRAVLANLSRARLGMTICYDIRFPHLYRRLAQSGADILTVPSAFSPVTGAAHWDVLLRARAIETGCFVLAPAQTGHHAASAGRTRQTWGRSMAIDPWGSILCDMGQEPGVAVVDLDLAAVPDARGRVPSLTHDRDFSL